MSHNTLAIKPMNSRIAVTKKEVEGRLMWCVQRLDGKPINSDGIVSYNFDLADWQKALDCRKRLKELSDALANFSFS